MKSFRLPSRKLRLRVIGAAVAVTVVVLGFATIKAAKPGVHLTECGVDAKGPYAKVSVNSLSGSGSTDLEGVTVGFTYNGYWYGGGVFGSTTTFVRGTWPPRVINPGWDGGPKGRIIVPGRVAGGHWTHFDPVTRVDPPGLRLTRHFKALVQPDDKSLLGCELLAPTDED